MSECCSEGISIFRHIYDIVPTMAHGAHLENIFEKFYIVGSQAGPGDVARQQNNL